jgi:hypothetical protein
MGCPFWLAARSGGGWVARPTTRPRPRAMGSCHGARHGPNRATRAVERAKGAIAGEGSGAESGRGTIRVGSATGGCGRGWPARARTVRRGRGGAEAVGQKSLLLLVTVPTCTLPNSPQMGRRWVRGPDPYSGVCSRVGSALGIERWRRRRTRQDPEGVPVLWPALHICG